MIPSNSLPPNKTLSTRYMARRFVAAVLLLSLVNAVSALPEDRRQSINLSSDRATYENNQGIYTGNVRMSQGSLKIAADQVIIIESDRKVTKVVARGNPARFEQQPRSGEGIVEASANLIEYELDAEEILLQQNARIQHQGSTISGDRIVYSGRKQLVVADGGSNQKDKRVQMTLQPQNNSDDEDADQSTAAPAETDSAGSTETAPPSSAQQPKPSQSSPSSPSPDQDAD